jgi:hypothetical protein
VLEGLDDVPWNTLHHAYGEATDVPELIRSLVSPEQGVRAKALWELYGNIWHQHTVYEASSRAVPFLLEVAVSPEVPDDTRAGVMQLLADIADGSSYVDVHEPVFEDMGVDLGVEPGQLERELEWVRRAREAVRGELGVLTRDLDPSAPGERRKAAVYVASMFPEAAEAVAPRLRAVRDAADEPSLRQGASLALALLGEEAMPEGLTVESTDDRGRPDVLSFEDDGGRSQQLSSSALHDTLFAE